MSARNREGREEVKGYRRATLKDARSINRWVLKGTGYACDFAPFIAERLNVFYINRRGGVMAIWRGPGVYEVHAYFPGRNPDWKDRGRAILSASRQFLDVLRERHGATMFWTSAPEGNRKARIFARLLGMKSEGMADLAMVGRSELFLLRDQTKEAPPAGDTGGARLSG
jgi:hypothetical protein